MASPLPDKSKAFALEIIKVCNQIKHEKKEQLRAVEQQPTTTPFKETPYTPIPFWTRKDNQRQYILMQSNIRAVAVGNDRYRSLNVVPHNEYQQVFRL